jgi:HD-GYP domain-containing protein (c-di-GMP phosphodiesterase class II)
MIGPSAGQTEPRGGPTPAGGSGDAGGHGLLWARLRRLAEARSAVARVCAGCRADAEMCQALIRGARDSSDPSAHPHPCLLQHCAAEEFGLSEDHGQPRPHPWAAPPRVRARWAGVSRASLYEVFCRAARALVLAIDGQPSQSPGHAVRVAELTLRAAMHGSRSAMPAHDLLVGGLLHDLGKGHISPWIMRKPTPLTEEEWREVRAHPALGADAIAPLADLAGLSHLVRHHHERFDGRGYPDGLAGEMIPAEARLIAACDAYDAMTSVRPYRAPLHPTAAREELRRAAGSQFDPDSVEALLQALERSPAQRWPSARAA